MTRFFFDRSGPLEPWATTREQYTISLQIEAAYWAEVSREEAEYWGALNHCPDGRSIQLQRISARVSRSARVAAGVETLEE